MAAWLIQKNYKGGELASGGTSEVESYYGHYSRIVGFQLWGVLDGTARDAAEGLAHGGRAVVR